MYELEPNGPGTLGNQLTLGQPMRAQLSGNSDQDNFYFITTDENQKVSLSFDAPNYNYHDYLLEIYSVSGSETKTFYSQRTSSDKEITVALLDPNKYFFRVSNGEAYYSAPTGRTKCRLGNL